MKILVLSGPNLNLLGTRDPSVYGAGSLKQLIDALQVYAFKNGVTIDHFQSNSEGELIDRLHLAVGNFDGVILNPGAYTHYSIALRDAVAAINIPVVEVHISNIHKRENFDGVILNPGAYTHYSIALRDAVSAINIPVVEVHISNIHKREPFRAVSVIAPACAGHITGLGREGYRLALDYFIGPKLVLEEKHDN